MKKFCLFLCLVSATLFGEPQVAANTTQKKYQAKNFTHLLGKVSGLDDALLTMHFKLYEGYVSHANSILERLQALTQNGQSRSPEFAGLKRMLGWELDGMLLHEYYFENLTGGAALDSQDPLYQKIVQDFGSFESWKADFIDTGLMRGIGWVVAYIDPKDGRLINQWINEHDVGHLAGGTPLLIMDVFEHAYITQFGLNRNQYIQIFFNNINWEVVSRRFKTKL